jgi:hypothetical protein
VLVEPRARWVEHRVKVTKGSDGYVKAAYNT